MTDVNESKQTDNGGQADAAANSQSYWRLFVVCVFLLIIGHFSFLFSDKTTIIAQLFSLIRMFANVVTLVSWLYVYGITGKNHIHWTAVFLITLASVYLLGN